MLAIFQELIDKSLLDFVEELTASETGIRVQSLYLCIRQAY